MHCNVLQMHDSRRRIYLSWSNGKHYRARNKAKGLDNRHAWEVVRGIILEDAS